MKPLKINKSADFGRVAVLMGGNAAEREISLKSGAAVYAALQKQQINVTAVDVGNDVFAAIG